MAGAGTTPDASQYDGLLARRALEQIDAFGLHDSNAEARSKGVADGFGKWAATQTTASITSYIAATAALAAACSFAHAAVCAVDAAITGLVAAACSGTSDAHLHLAGDCASADTTGRAASIDASCTDEAATCAVASDAHVYLAGDCGADANATSRAASIDAIDDSAAILAAISAGAGKAATCAEAPATCFIAPGDLTRTNTNARAIGLGASTHAVVAVATPSILLDAAAVVAAAGAIVGWNVVSPSGVPEDLVAPAPRPRG